MEKLSLQVPDQLNVFDQGFENGLFSNIAETSYLEKIYPTGFVSSKDNVDPLIFLIRGDNHWIDFSKSYMLLKCKVIGVEHKPASSGSGTPVLATDVDASAKADGDFGLCNSFFHSIFSSINVSVGNTSISINNENYPYIAHIQNICNLSSDYQETLGGTFGYNRVLAKVKENLLSTEDTMTGVIGLKSPLLLSKKNLLPFMDVLITCNRIPNNEFYFSWSPPGTNPKTNARTYKLLLKEVVYNARKVKVDDRHNLMIDSHLNRDNSIHYALNDCRVITKMYTNIPISYLKLLKTICFTAFFRKE